MNQTVNDIDFVINIDIELFLKKISKKNIKINKRNIKYHTVSIILDKNEYQITSFRKDLVTFGRAAHVDFVNGLYEDAKRRDFTINTLYLDHNGNLIDPYNGYQHIIEKKLKFVGDPIERIREDYLRIIRYCRFFGAFSRFDHLKNLKSKVLKLLPNIKILSNDRIKKEFLKILLEDKVDICLFKMKSLALDKFILVDRTNDGKGKEFKGFKINNFEIINHIKRYIIDIAQNEKLDLLCVIIPHLYELDRLDDIVRRFEFNKKKIKYLNFIKKLQSLKYFIEENNFNKNFSGEKKIKFLQLIWKFRININSSNITIFENDRIPFNWYKLGLLHMIPFQTITLADFSDLDWPSFPLHRNEIKGLQLNMSFNNQNNLLYKAEEFWVKNKFKSSKEDILDFVNNTLIRNDKV